MPQHEEEFIPETSCDKQKEDGNNSSTSNVMSSESDCSPENLYYYCSYCCTLFLEKWKMFQVYLLLICPYNTLLSFLSTMCKSSRLLCGNYISLSHESDKQATRLWCYQPTSTVLLQLDYWSYIIYNSKYKNNKLWHFIDFQNIYRFVWESIRYLCKYILEGHSW